MAVIYIHMILVASKYDTTSNSCRTIAQQVIHVCTKSRQLICIAYLFIYILSYILFHSLVSLIAH